MPFVSVATAKYIDYLNSSMLSGRYLGIIIVGGRPR
jgi:hypothetical protein